jgi:ABC-type Na+ transport system ATPase subunit NatA
MIELCDGTISVDGINITTLPRQAIRSAIIGLPQDPLVLEGSTIRGNVDPFDYCPDDAIISTLKRVGLWEILDIKGGLETIASPELFSHGQRQLLCMAKAMLRHGNIIVFDEATSGYVFIPQSPSISHERRKKDPNGKQSRPGNGRNDAGAHPQLLRRAHCAKRNAPVGHNH